MIVVRNVNVPLYRSRVNAEMYAATLRALLKVLPAKPPGLTQAEMFSKVKRHLPRALFPDGEKVGWWVKTVQLDQEAKRAIVRELTTPLRWHRKKPR
jgi:hypothetical protein